MSRLNQFQSRENKAVVNPFSIAELDDRYVISPVKYRNGLYEVAWSKELLSGGNYYTQDKWLKLLHGSEWSLPSCPLYHATLAALHHQSGGSNGLVETLRNMFQDDFSKQWMMTSTKIKYKARGSDKVIHELGSPEEYEIDAEITGPDGWLNSLSGYVGSIEALFGTNDLWKVETAFEWVSGENSYLWSMYSKQNTVRTLVLGVDDDDRLCINAGGIISGNRPARGVASHKISNGNRGKKR